MGLTVKGMIAAKTDWLVVLGFNATLTATGISWRSLTHTCLGVTRPFGISKIKSEPCNQNISNRGCFRKWPN